MNDSINAKINTKIISKIKISVEHVYKANFNDSMQIADAVILLEEIKDKPLLWFDPYLGLNKKQQIEIAVVSVDDEEVTYYEKNNGEIKVITKELILDYILADDLNEQLLIATHISPETR